MMTPVPLEILTPELHLGETVEWTGRPNPSVVFHNEDGFLIPISLVWGGGAIMPLLDALGILVVFPNKSADALGVIWAAAAAVFGQYFIWGRFVYSYWKKKRTFYALTNRRAIIVRFGRHRSTSSAYFENLPMLDWWLRRDGIGSISFGGPLGMGQFRGRRSTPRPPTFDDVDNVDFVYQLALRLHDEARKPGNGPVRPAGMFQPLPERSLLTRLHQGDDGAQ